MYVCMYAYLIERQRSLLSLYPLKLITHETASPKIMMSLLIKPTLVTVECHCWQLADDVAVHCVSFCPTVYVTMKEDIAVRGGGAGELCCGSARSYSTTDLTLADDETFTRAAITCDN
jgi:hypothetical protein